jgi:hypothetical protein
MELLGLNSNTKTVSKSMIFDLVGISFVYFLPALSHLFALPLYYLDPMRLMLILAMVHTNRTNTIVLGLTLPIVSFFITSHPVFLKAGIISMELAANIFLFYWLIGKNYTVLLSAAISIIASKLLYYLIKDLCINFGLLDSPLVTTPISFQLAMTVLLSIYMWFVIVRFKKRNNI